ncbi:MAG: hypothetical protein AAF742_06010, partial [Pseudomonadota bacterium]
ANEAEEAAAARETVSQGRLFASSANAPLKGLLMEEEDRTPTTTNDASSSNSTELRTVDVIWPPLAALALLFGWAYWPFPRPHAS